jgi:hypothetical protein
MTFIDEFHRVRHKYICKHGKNPDRISLSRQYESDVINYFHTQVYSPYTPNITKLSLCGCEIKFVTRPNYIEFLPRRTMKREIADCNKILNSSLLVV